MSRAAAKGIKEIPAQKRSFAGASETQGLTLIFNHVEFNSLPGGEATEAFVHTQTSVNDAQVREMFKTAIRMLESLEINSTPRIGDTAKQDVIANTADVIDQALAIVHSAPQDADETEVVSCLEAVKQLIQESGIKLSRRERRGLDGDLIVLALKPSGTSARAMELLHEIIGLLTPERANQQERHSYVLPELTEEEVQQLATSGARED